MIITLSGVPCSGKGTCVSILKNKYVFDSISTGDLYRQEAKKVGMDVLEFNQKNKDYDIDKKIDDMSKEIGKKRKDDKLIFDSRMAWFFVPYSFKVFITIPHDVMAERLYNSDRDIKEKSSSKEEAKRRLISRFDEENKRYRLLYGVDNTNLGNYDFVIDNSNMTPEETADAIYDEYKKFCIKNNVNLVDWSKKYYYNS